MLTYDFCTISLIFLSCITQKSYAANNQNSCFAYPLEEVAPNKTVYFGTIFEGNFFEAANYCRRHCMQLLSINSEIEQKGIEDYLKKSPYTDNVFWTSGNDLGKEGLFTWGSTGERITYTKWIEGEPNNLVRNGIGENCIMIWNDHDYKWNDDICTAKKYFICEIQPEYFGNSYRPS